jgi:iron(III) transport system substrate-binding protein
LAPQLACLAFAFLASPTFAADPALVDAAKKEGKVVWYTSAVVDQLVRPSAAAFEAKYGIKVEFARTDSSAIILRVMNEGRAGAVQGDLIDGFGAPALVKAGLVAKWQPDYVSKFPKQFVDANGYWTATFQIVLTPGYNTQMIAPAKAPRTLEDLLDPALKGKMAWDNRASNSGAGGFIGLVLRELGEAKGLEFLRRLERQNISGLQVSARQVLDQVIAGEYALGLQIFNHHAGISAAQGAPVDWIPMNPALGVMSVAYVTQGAPHPNAGRLLLDFLGSNEGQQVYRDADYMPTNPAVEPRNPKLRPDGDKFRAIYMTPEETDVEMPKWTQIYKDIFR